MCDNSKELEALRVELAALKRQLRQEQYNGRARHNRSSSTYHTLDFCHITIRDNFTAAGLASGRALLGPHRLGTPISEIFGTESGEKYWAELEDLAGKMKDWSKPPADDRWETVLSTDAEPDVLQDWIQEPERGWVLKDNTARTIPAEGVEYFLSSPAELVDPAEDFRVTYKARAEGEPADLSVIVGGALEKKHSMKEQSSRPEASGYCFAFGVHSNCGTELQRAIMPVSRLADTIIGREKDYVCTAERVGGLLRFEVDGEEVFRTMDILPLMHGDHGYISLYCCNPGSVFWDVKVMTRPTAIDAESLARIDKLRKVILETSGPAPFLEVHYVGNNMFLCKDVTEREALRQQLDK